MHQKHYRVIQWATGKVGQVAIRHFAANPAFELAGVYVTSPDKVGRDAGEIAGVAPLGIAATDDMDAILALDADCVLFAPRVEDIDLMCRILRSGKNVVTPLGPFYGTPRYAEQLSRLDAAAKAGGVSFHGTGIHPGFAGDLLPITMLRLMSRVDRVHVYEVVDHLANPSPYIQYMGFGRDPEDLRANPARAPDAHLMFAPSMAMVAEALGRGIDEVTAEVELATATEDTPYPGGVVRAGTVAGQHYQWTGWSSGRPLVTFHCYWVMGDGIAPRWDCGTPGYRVRMEGDAPLQLTLSGLDAEGRPGYPRLSLTALLCANIVPAVCQAPPGVVTHFDLGVVKPLGLVR